jgi:hypothetical protein
MSLKPDDLPSNLASAQAALLIEREALRAEREARLRVEVEAINWRAEAANARAVYDTRPGFPMGSHQSRLPP